MPIIFPIRLTKEKITIFAPSIGGAFPAFAG